MLRFTPQTYYLVDDLRHYLCAEGAYRTVYGMDDHDVLTLAAREIHYRGYLPSRPSLPGGADLVGARMYPYTVANAYPQEHGFFRVVPCNVGDYAFYLQNKVTE
ncbi:MAG: hypothetical protein ACE5G0_09985 [Rhodothermales bacterium]